MIRVLGPVGLGSGDEVTTIRGQQQKLLGLLAVNFPNLVERPVIVEALWPNDGPKSTKNNLGVVLFRLRNRLPDEVEIVTEGRFYRLKADPMWLDHAVFSDLVDQAEARFQTNRATDHVDPVDWAKPVTLLREALGLWRGQAFQPFEDGDRFEAQATALTEKKRFAEELLLDVLLASDEAHEATMLGTALTKEEPYRERRWELLMRALYQTGQQAEALRVGQRARSILLDAGLQPGPQLQQLESAILNHDSELQSTSQRSIRDGVDDSSGHETSTVEPMRQRRSPFIAVPPAVAAPIPTSATRFIGRAVELAALAEVIEGHRWVTICGAPGIGKSRLMNRFAKGESDRRVIWLNGADMKARDVQGQLAKVMGLGPNDDQQLDALTDALSYEPTLLVLDNIEPGDAALHLLSKLSSDGDDLRIVATSRSTFEHELEFVFNLSDLSTDDALTLVQDEANIDIETAQTLVDNVGHLPLILEILVGQFQLATVEEILNDLGQTLQPLGKSVEAALDWSIQRLDPSTLDLYDYMGIMAGWCTVADLAGVTKRSTADVRYRLNELVNQSLVRSSRSGTASTGITLYRQDLSMRTHARLRLEADNRLHEATAGHTEYFHNLALHNGAAITGPDEQDAVDHLNRVSDDLRLTFDRLLDSQQYHRAIDFVLALDEYTFFRLKYDKLGWQDQLVDVPAAAEHAGYARLLATASLAAWVRDRMGPATDLADRAMAVASQRNEDVPIPALRAKLNVAAAEQDILNAPQLLSQLVDVSNRSGSDREISNTSVNEALAFTYLGMAEEALTAANRAVETAARSSNPTSMSWAKCGLGFAQLLVGPKPAALAFAEALRLARTVQNQWTMATALSGIATAARLSGRSIEAAESLATLLDIWTTLRKDTFLARTLNETALLLAEINRDDEARRVLSWTNGFTADVLFLPQDRQSLIQLRRRLDPPLASEMFSPRPIATQARSLLLRSGDPNPHSP